VAQGREIKGKLLVSFFSLLFIKLNIGYQTFRDVIALSVPRQSSTQARSVESETDINPRISFQLSEIRDFPKALPDTDGDIMKHVYLGLRNCTNLRACTWTRDGSLDSDILKVLHSCDTLEELELNGHSTGHYDTRLLLGFTHLRRISIIMPSAAVVSQLRPWLSLTGETLRSLTLICKVCSLNLSSCSVNLCRKASGFITDQTLESIAPFLVNLEHLHLTGCPKVTSSGVWAILSSNAKGLIGLGLEGVSPKFVSYVPIFSIAGYLKTYRTWPHSLANAYH